jgi:hypothetical protein
MNGATDRGIISLCMYKGENWSTTDQQRIELRYMNTIVDVAYDNKVFDRKYQCHFYLSNIEIQNKKGKIFCLILSLINR